jgi:hypothetical protein
VRGKLLIYFGGGIRYKFQDDADDRFDFRAPVGLSSIFDDIPVDIFCEVAPILDVTPRSAGNSPWF